MEFFEVILRLVRNGRPIGRTCLQVRAATPFLAAMDAEKVINGRYGQDTFSHAIEVEPITAEEFIYCRAA